MKSYRSLFAALLLFTTAAYAQKPNPTGSAHGVMLDATSHQPIEYVTVTLKKSSGETVVKTATDAKGAFEFPELPFGDYQIAYGAVGADQLETAKFTVDAQHPAADLGKLNLAGDGTVKLQKMEVSARKEAFYNSIDRKVYNVGKDVQSVTGSASDLLQNVPSIQVDIEGNVSLRGDSNVLILINGKTSTMMGKNRAAVLEQMPADSIEKVEVITNPSAKYKPDGTAGIINLTLKKNREAAGYSGNVRAVVGNDRRYSLGLLGSYPIGKYTLHGSASVRQDDRPRFGQDDRSHLDTATNTFVSTSQRTTETGRPLSRIVQGGADYKVDDKTKVGLDVHYNYRDFDRRSTITNLSRNGSGVLTGDYDRVRFDPEFEKDLEFTGTFQHSFPKEDHEISVEVRHGKTTEGEDNHYTNVYRVPALISTQDATRIRNIEDNTESSADYTYPISDDSKLEAGYNGQLSRLDQDFRGSFFDPTTGSWVVDTTRTNRFIYSSKVHAFYSTYAQKIDRFGVLAGLRFEQALVDTNQITARLVDKTEYNKLYPSLHLSFDLTDTQQLQANYSHRVRRPEGDDVNPFPEYQDPFNLRAGNPHLKPEEAHSIETGYQYRKNDTTYLATVYYRYRYNGMTDVTRYINATTQLTTKENLSTSRSGGMELGATTRLKDRVSLNFSGNIYHNEINASNLGFSANRSTTAWDAKLNATWDITKLTLMQLNTNYTAKRLTPQGYRYPTYVTNIGLRHALKDKKMAFILSVSDVFNTQRERTHIDTSILHQESIRRRSSRIINLGFTYNFGKPTKKKEDIQFDTSL